VRIIHQPTKAYTYVKRVINLLKKSLKNNTMRIAIIGTRGIPNHYGGFEQCAEYLAAGLARKGYEVVVYNSHNHPYQEKQWKGVEICHCYDPEFKLGTIGQFFYDLNCIRDLRKREFDVILQLGYTSSSVWGWLLPRTTVVTTNMDGMEWKRDKYSKPVQKFLRFAESLAVRYSDHLISDSVEIQRYIQDKYNKPSTYIPYGAEAFNNPDAFALEEFGMTPYNYDMLIARMEPENSIETILDGVAKANTGRNFMVVGRTDNPFGIYLKEKFAGFPGIKFVGGIYNMDKLNNLRYYSNVYFHGHTVGGTNPSLLEAMASNSLICSHDNRFNRAVLGADALYFANADDIAAHLTVAHKSDSAYLSFLANNMTKIREVYTCDNIINAYAAHFESIRIKDMNLHPSTRGRKEVALTLEHV
jgi:glycosyltransferase involved in cell wall biosynthesis